MTHARIGKITMKNGGAEVRVLRQATPDPSLEGGAENWCGQIIRSARACAEFSEPGSELCGFVVLGLYSDGRSSLGFRYDPKRCPMPSALLPAYVAEVIRRDVITEKIACDVVNRANGWDEPPAS